MKRENLRSYLERIYNEYGHLHSSKDPVWILHNFKSESDIEIAGLILSCYSYGRVEQINQMAKKLFQRTGPNVREFTLNFSEQKDKKHMRNLAYRFNSNGDVVLLIRNIQRLLIQHGSLKALFALCLQKEDINTANALKGFTKELNHISGSHSYSYLVPLAERRSACKRLNLFLRWMVRKDNIDLGVWNDVGKDRLLFPVDTHVYRVSRTLKMCKRKSCDLDYSIELTEFLKRFDSEDPVKYDFALCHLGIDGRQISV